MIVSPTPARRGEDETLLDAGLAARLDRLDVLSRKMFAGKLPGERRSKRRGQSVEFDDYRMYLPGDDLRHVDWNVFARLDRFFIKLFREDEDLSVSIVIDTSPSMRAGFAQPNAAVPEGRPSKLAYALRLAMALAYVGLVNQNRVSIATFGGDPAAGLPRRLAPMRGRRNVERAAAFLSRWLEPSGGGAGAQAGAMPGGTEDFAEAIRPIAVQPGGRGVLILLSDLLFPEGIERGMSLLAAGGAGGAGYDAVLLQTLSPGELDPRKDRELGILGDLRLTDIETGRPAEVTVSRELLAAYDRRLAAHLGRITKAATARGLRHRVVSTVETPESVIFGHLRRAGILG